MKYSTARKTCNCSLQYVVCSCICTPELYKCAGIFENHICVIGYTRTKYMYVCKPTLFHEGTVISCMYVCITKVIYLRHENVKTEVMLN